MKNRNQFTYSTDLKLIPTADGHDVLCSVKLPVTTEIPHTQWHIHTLKFYLNDTVAADFSLGPNVSRDPIIGIHLTGLKFGDSVSIKWIDTRNNHGNALVFVQ